MKEFSFGLLCGAIFRSKDDTYRGGWIRLWTRGPGVHWIPNTAPRLFSDREKRVRYLVIRGWRLRTLPRVRS